nr:MATE family efflux transporter [uncultured Dorea sp.]
MSTTFFTRDKNFYKTFFRLMIVVALQNLVAYSVNMLDNIMLGSYSQSALSGAATVNQIFFIVNQLALSIGNALVAMSSQYWGKKETGQIRNLTGVALTISMMFAVVIVVLCSVIPEQLLRIFTTSPEIIAEGKVYLGLLKWTFILFMISNLLIAMLRSVETVKISFIISVISLITNGCINYTLIFGKFGFPEMGIRGAAIGTLTARTLELLIVACYIWKIDKKVRLFGGKLLHITFAPENKKMWGAYLKVALPIMCSGMIWAISVPMQTAILGHLSSDAIAANSVSSTFFQYLKVIVIAISSASAVVVGKDIGAGDIERVKSDARTLSVIDVCIGIVLALLLFVLRKPLLSMYKLNDTAAVLADHFIMVMSGVMIGMSYQMPVSVGIIQGAGDTKFSMCMNLISTWGIVMPLSLLSAFVWKLPVELVVVAVQSDQLFKGIPVFLRFRSYKWIHKLT